MMSVSATRTYSNRSNCIAGARSALGNPGAKVDVDFRVEKIGDRFAFSVLAATTTVDGNEVTVGTATFSTEPEPAPANPPVGDDLGIPDILKREPETPEQADERRKRFAKLVGPDRKISMPKTTTKKKGKAIAKSGSKHDLLVALLRANWCDLDDVTKATAWLPHSARAEISRLASRDGFTVDKRRDKDGMQYRITAGPKK